MKSQSLKFFPRQSKLSTEEQLFLSDFNVVNKDRVANQRLESFAVYILLRMKMSEDDYTGYYLKYEPDIKNLLAHSIGTDNKFLNRVIYRCLERGLFDKLMFQKYNILTSESIQDEYFKGKERCSKMQVINDYLYESIRHNYEKLLKKFEIVNINGEIVNIFKQTTQDDTNTNNMRKDQTTALNDFLSHYPNKKETVKDIPDNVDFKLLKEKLDESDFLQKANNLKLNWLILNYNNILNDTYKNYSNKKLKEFENHQYTEEQYNSLFTNLDEIKL